ncbi:MAG: hypothetical protein C4325_01480 [Blastocatellia bacterium]
MVKCLSKTLGFMWIKLHSSFYQSSIWRFIFAISLLTAIIFIFSAAIVIAQEEEQTQKAIAYFQQGQDAHEKGNFQSAAELYKKALSIVPDFPEAEFQLGNAYVSLNRPDEAEAAFRRAAELRDDWTPPLAALGSLYVGQERFKEAQPLLSRALKDEPRNPVALSALTELYLKTDADVERLRELLSRLTEATASARPTAILLSAKASVELRLGNAQAAIESAERALSIDPQMLSAAITAANAALAKNDPESAENYLRKVRAIGRGRKEADLVSAKIAFARGENDAAIRLLEPLAKESAEAARLLTTIRAATTLDLPALEKSLESEPKNIEILGRLCQAFRQQDPAKALEYCQRANSEKPEEIRFAAGYAAALVQAKRYDEAIGLLKSLISVEPNNATMRANLATALFQANRLQEAKAEFIWLVERPNPSPVAFRCSRKLSKVSFGRRSDHLLLRNRQGEASATSSRKSVKEYEAQMRHFAGTA